jgi:hypothetical protein
MPFREVVAREKDDDGRPSKEMGLTLIPLLDHLLTIFAEGLALDLSGLE